MQTLYAVCITTLKFSPSINNLIHHQEGSIQIIQQTSFLHVFSKWNNRHVYFRLFFLQSFCYSLLE